LSHILIIKYQRVVKVKSQNTEPPVIFLNGQEQIDIKLGMLYTELGAIANDNQDGDLTSQIIISGFVDTDKLGTYYISYKATDSDGNQSQKIRTINVVKHDQVYPVIVLNGDSHMYLKVGQNYTDHTATDQNSTCEGTQSLGYLGSKHTHRTCTSLFSVSVPRALIWALVRTLI